MSLRARLDSVDVPSLILSLVVGGLALAALMLLVDRLERIAQANPVVADHGWSAPAGSELRLSGLRDGPLVGVETSPGGGLTVSAPVASMANGGPQQRLLWMSQGKGDNKSEVQVALVGQNGSVALSRSGEAETPQLQIRVENAKLMVQAGVTVGDSLLVPVVRTIFGQRDIAPTGLASSFIIPPGGTLSIELPVFPDGTPSGVVTWLGAVGEQEDTSLPLREVGIAREGVAAPDKAACAADRRYAWQLFFRPALFPVPGGSDCKAGVMTARGLSISRDSVAVSLAGYAWQLEGGMPTASLWSWAKSNPVLSLVINKLLPSAVGLILAMFTWRRRTAVSAPQVGPERSRARRAH